MKNHLLYTVSGYSVIREIRRALSICSLYTILLYYCGECMHARRLSCVCCCKSHKFSLFTPCFRKRVSVRVLYSTLLLVYRCLCWQSASLLLHACVCHCVCVWVCEWGGGGMCPTMSPTFFICAAKLTQFFPFLLVILLFVFLAQCQ